MSYQSETSKVRHLVLPYIEGYTCDIGFGGDKIIKKAIGIDFARPYADCGTDSVDIQCNVLFGIPVHDSMYDTVYSSHLVEDFEDTENILKEFIRICKPNGNLIIVVPDQKKYEEQCKKDKSMPNPCHKIKEMGMNYVINVLHNINQYNILYCNDCEIDYNAIVVCKVKK